MKQGFERCSGPLHSRTELALERHAWEARELETIEAMVLILRDVLTGGLERPEITVHGQRFAPSPSGRRIGFGVYLSQDPVQLTLRTLADLGAALERRGAARQQDRARRIERGLRLGSVGCCARLKYCS